MSSSPPSDTNKCSIESLALRAGWTRSACVGESVPTITRLLRLDGLDYALHVRAVLSDAAMEDSSFLVWHRVERGVRPDGSGPMVIE